MQNGVLQRLLDVLDLGLGVVGQQFSTNVQISRINGGKQRNISVLKRNFMIQLYSSLRHSSTLFFSESLTSIFRNEMGHRSMRNAAELSGRLP